MEIYNIDYSDLSQEEQQRVKETIEARTENKLISLEAVSYLFV